MNKHKKKSAVSFVGIIVCLATLGLGQHASAQDPMREGIPIVAGTHLRFIQTNRATNCTAGLVLKSTSRLSRITPYQQAVRYVLTAGHCGNVGNSVNVADLSVGRVIWKSGRYDLALVRIEPYAQRRTICSAPSTGPVCSIGVTYNPRAVGKVIIASQRTRGEQAIPINGTGVPADREVFCTSGAFTGVICSWGKTQLPPRWRFSEQNRHFSLAETFSSNIVDGDSGGPVVSFSGKIYGIMAESGDPHKDLATILLYNSINQFFEEQPNYAVAPTN